MIQSATGSMGSTVHCIRGFPRKDMNLLRKVDWNRLGRRVSVDFAEGLISWMAPSSIHEGLARTTDDVVKAAGYLEDSQVVVRGSTRWKGSGDPKGSGLEADASFYIGATAEAWYEVAERGDAAILDFEAANPPDLVVEVEVTHLDEGKAKRYATLGIREMWQVVKKESDAALAVNILDLQAPGGPRTMTASRLLPVLTEISLAQALEMTRNAPPETVRERLQALLEDQPEQVREREDGADLPEPTPFVDPTDPFKG